MGCQYNAIFKCGGRMRNRFGARYSSRKASMIIFKEGEMEKDSEEMDAHAIELPQLPPSHNAQFARTVFSREHGLITIYGKKVFLLDVLATPFDDNESDACWIPIHCSSFLRHTNPLLSGPICTLVNDDNSLFICSQA